MIHSSLRRRIEALEHRVIGGSPIVLHMQDGSVHQLPGTAKHYFKLAALLDSVGESPLHAELRWIKDAVYIEEEGRHTYELLRALLQGPNEVEESESCVPMR